MTAPSAHPAHRFVDFRRDSYSSNKLFQAAYTRQQEAINNHAGPDRPPPGEWIGDAQNWFFPSVFEHTCDTLEKSKALWAVRKRFADELKLNEARIEQAWDIASDPYKSQAQQYRHVEDAKDAKRVVKKAKAARVRADASAKRQKRREAKKLRDAEGEF